MKAQKRVLLFLVVIGLLLVSVMPVLAEEPAAAGARPEAKWVAGRVIAVGGATLELRTLDGNVTFLTNDRTRYRVPGVESATLSDVQVGDLAIVAAVKKAGGGLMALLVAVRPERVRLDGDVTQIAGNNLKIRNPGGERLVHTDDGTVFRVAGIEEPTLADIAVGDHVHGFAILQGQGALWGRLIAVVDEHKLRGQVTAIQDGAISVSRPDGAVTFRTDDLTRYRVPGVGDPMLADVHVGDLVAVAAFGQEDGTLLAKVVAVLKGIRFEGLVTAKEGAVLTLSTDRGPLQVLTDADTRYRVPDVGNPTLDDVSVGDRVRVVAVSQGPGGGLLAKGIGVIAAE